MLAIKIDNVKTFMNQLLIGNTFDSFSLIEASITTFNHFSIDGTLHPDFFDTDIRNSLTESGRVYSLWKELKSYCYSLTKGRIPPLQFKYVFCLPPLHAASVCQSALEFHVDPAVKNFVFNIQYKNQELICTTGVAFSTFTLDKSAESLWDSLIVSYLRKNQLDYHNL